MRKAQFLMLLTTLTAALPMGAFAQDDAMNAEAGSLPARHADRPLTLPQNTLRAEVGLGVAHAELLGASVNVDRLALGASYGITDDIEVGAVIAPLTLGVLDSEFDYQDPSVRARYRVIDGPVEIAAEAETQLPLSEDADPNLTVRLPVRIQANDLRIDTGLETRVTFGEQDTFVQAAVPVAASLNLTDEIHAGLSTGLAVGDMANAGDSLSMPLGVHAGYTIDSGALVTDLGVGFALPAFVTGSEIVTNEWRAMLNANIHFNL